MILLDTDHVTLLKYPSSERAERLVQRLDGVPAEAVVGVTIITVEEQMRGWLAAIAKERAASRQVTAYRELGTCSSSLQRSTWPYLTNRQPSSSTYCEPRRSGSEQWTSRLRRSPS